MPINASLAQSVIALTNLWGNGTRAAWDRTSISYSIGTTTGPVGVRETPAIFSMTAKMRTVARETFEVWDDLIAINLDEHTNNIGSDILFNYSYITDRGGSYTRLGAETGGARVEARLTNADIWLNSGWSSHNEDRDLTYGSYGVMTYIHEIGHALGLSHPGQYNAGSALVITWDNSATLLQDTQQYTLMSYFRAGSNHQTVDHYGSNGLWAYAATPLLHDIAAIQSLYGADMTTRTGSTTYGFHSTAGRAAFDFTVNTNPVVAIWDAGGVDTIDVSGWSTRQTVDLRAGAFSSVGHLTHNLAIAYGTVIENAIGGGGDDRLIGNDAANLLRGGLGADLLNGGAGNDTLLGEAGSDSLYGEDGNDVLRGGAGVDLLTGGLGADRFQFTLESDSGVTGTTWDTVADFRAAQLDKIDLSALDANSALTGAQDFTGLIASTAAFTMAGQLRFKVYSGYIVLEGNTDADATAEFAVRINGVTSLSNADIIL